MFGLKEEVALEEVVEEVKIKRPRKKKATTEAWRESGNSPIKKNVAFKI
jgi:hypothetical protein